MNREAAPRQDVVGFGLWLGGLEEGAVVSSRLGVSGGMVTLQWRILINPYPAGGETRVELRI